MALLWGCRVHIAVSKLRGTGWRDGGAWGPAPNAPAGVWPAAWFCVAAGFAASRPVLFLLRVVEGWLCLLITPCVFNNHTCACEIRCCPD